MTDREAAGRLARMAEGGTNFSRESGEACRMGAEAIREREERSKGCSGCFYESKLTTQCNDCVRAYSRDGYLPANAENGYTPEETI